MTKDIALRCDVCGMIIELEKNIPINSDINKSKAVEVQIKYILTEEEYPAIDCYENLCICRNCAKHLFRYLKLNPKELEDYNND